MMRKLLARKKKIKSVFRREHNDVLSESPLFNNFGYIFLGCSPFPRRTHRVRTAGMSLSKKNLSRNSCIKRLRENIMKRGRLGLWQIKKEFE